VTITTLIFKQFIIRIPYLSFSNCVPILKRLTSPFQTKMTRRMAIANGTCVSFCNQPKAHYLATSRSRVTPAGAGIWLCQRESKAHFGLWVYAPGRIAVNVTWMEREFNACQRIAASTYLSSSVSQ